MQVIRKQPGFTLIEVMIVVAILGILAALAFPQYQTFTTRAKISEGLVQLGPVKLAVAEYYAAHGRLPNVSGNNWQSLLRELGLNVGMTSAAASGRYVKRIWWYNKGGENIGRISIKYGFDPVDEKILNLEAVFSASGQAIWTCKSPGGSDGVSVRYLPSTCRG